MDKRAVPGQHPSLDGAPAPVPGAKGRLPVELAGAILRGRFAVPILWSLFWGGRSFYQLLRALEGLGPRGLEAELCALERKGVVRLDQASRARGRRLYALTPSGERLKLVLGLMHEWGLAALADPELAPRVCDAAAPGSSGATFSGSVSDSREGAGP